MTIGGVGTTSSFNTTSGQARTHVIDGTHFVVPVNDNNTHPNGQTTGYIPYNTNDITQEDIKAPPPPFTPTTPKYQTYATNPPPKLPKSPQRPMSPRKGSSSSENPKNAWGETRPLATDQGVEFYSVNSDSPLPRRPSSPVVTVPRPLSPASAGIYRPRVEDIPMQTMFDDEYEMPPARQQQRIQYQKPRQGSHDNNSGRRERNLQRDNSTDNEWLHQSPKGAKPNVESLQGMRYSYGFVVR